MESEAAHDRARRQRVSRKNLSVSSIGQNLISVVPLTAKRALAEIDHDGR
jgi:hypothetical protein